MQLFLDRKHTYTHTNYENAEQLACIETTGIHTHTHTHSDKKRKAACVYTMSHTAWQGLETASTNRNQSVFTSQSVPVDMINLENAVQPIDAE